MSQIQLNEVHIFEGITASALGQSLQKYPMDSSDAAIDGNAYTDWTATGTSTSNPTNILSDTLTTNAQDQLAGNGSVVLTNSNVSPFTIRRIEIVVGEKDPSKTGFTINGTKTYFGSMGSNSGVTAIGAASVSDNNIVCYWKEWTTDQSCTSVGVFSEDSKDYDTKWYNIRLFYGK